MVNLVVCTLVVMFLVLVVYDQIQYRLYVRSVEKGIVGKIRTYRTPHNINKFCRNVGLLWKSLTAKES